jgi:hypothetical protein
MYITELFENIQPKHAAFCFGRMNPPTLGHRQLINTVTQAAQGGDFYIFTSQSQDSEKNPLDYKTKVQFLRALYPNIANHIVYDTNVKTIMHVAGWLYNHGYTAVTFVAGADRLADFKELLTKYNGVEGKHNYYKFDQINFVSSGDRDADDNGVEGISASAARNAAKEGDIELFAQITGAGIFTKSLYNAVRRGMNIPSELNEFAPTDFNSINGEGFNPGIAKMAEDDGVVKGASLADSVSLNRAIAISDWDTAHGGSYKQYFVKGFKDGRLNKIAHDNKHYDLNLVLNKDGTISNRDQGLAEESSGYIPKNKKEAKDPRWSMALSVDVTPDTPRKNAKAFRLI